MSKVAPPLPPGRWLTPAYKVLACLSRGRVADVYDVWSKERDCRCVAKVLRPERFNDRKSWRVQLREGRLLRGLSHPHIVRFYEILWVPSPVLILETLTGATLSHIIKNTHRLGLDDQCLDVVADREDVDSVASLAGRAGADFMGGWRGHWRTPWGRATALGEAATVRR